MNELILNLLSLKMMIREDIQTANFVRFRKDQPDWACVFGLCNGPTRVRFVHVPNRIYQTLAAIIFKYYAHGSVIHIDGWRGYTP